MGAEKRVDGTLISSYDFRNSRQAKIEEMSLRSDKMNTVIVTKR
jgi:hypothetical protein